MKKVKFISYDGKWPNLCNGTLRFSVDGKPYYGSCLLSGGYVVWNGCEKIVEGPWRIAWDYIKDEDGLYIEDNHFDDAKKREILFQVNENVVWGCCGGCL